MRNQGGAVLPKTSRKGATSGACLGGQLKTKLSRGSTESKGNHGGLRDLDRK